MQITFVLHRILCFILAFMCDDNRLSIQNMAFICLLYGSIWPTEGTPPCFLCSDLSLFVPLLSPQVEIEQVISNPGSLLSTQLDWRMKTFLFLTFLQLGWTSSLGEDLCQIKKQHMKPLPGYFQNTRDGVELELVIMLLHGGCQQLYETLFWKG